MKARNTSYRKLWIGIGILILLAPLGLILPGMLKAGGAWGEWSVDQIKEIAGYVPEGMKRIAQLWGAPLSDYAFPGWDKGIRSYIAYIVSGFIGVAIVAGVAYVVGRVLKRNERSQDE